MSKTSQKNTLCVMPWIHLHVRSDSTIIPCCSSQEEVFGDLKEEDLEQVWNNNKFKKLRARMLAGEYSSECRHCYEIEKAGFVSLRQEKNAQFKKDLAKIFLAASLDGHVQHIHFKTFDLRISNHCNFKCRTCGPAYSSSWFQDSIVMNPVNTPPSKYNSIEANSHAFWEKARIMILDAQHIYFGGGEPLIMKEHFDLLRWLIDKERTQIDLVYNTNLSTLSFSNHYLPDIWKYFRSVEVGVSLDDIGKRAEYIRSGTKWEKVVENLRKLNEESSRIKVLVYCTVNILNVFYLPELYTYLLEEKLIKDEAIVINLLIDPPELKCDVLPAEAKNKVHLKLRKFASELKAKGYNKLSSDIEKIIGHMLEKDNSHLLSEFLEKTKKLDEIRNENFFEVYFDHPLA